MVNHPNRSNPVIVYINDQVLDGNLGEGWTDNYEAARAHAEYLRAEYLSEARELFGDDADIRISIDVQRNTSGTSRGVSVSVRTDDEKMVERGLALEERLQDYQTHYWDTWVDSSEAENYIA